MRDKTMELAHLLSPSCLLLLGAGLQLAVALLCWPIAEARIGFTVPVSTLPQQLRVPTATSHHDLRQQPAHPHHPASGRRRQPGNAMIERDAA
jgi:hypothetical protein